MPPAALLQSPTSVAIDAAIALTAMDRVAAAWGINRAQIARLLAVPERTLRAWHARPPARLDAVVLERISHLIAIYDGLHRLFGDDPYADRWPHEPNAAFAATAPLTLLLTGTFTNLVTLRLSIDQALQA